MAEANETLPVLTSDLFAWIPRWRDKLVLEAWSLGTFMRMDWAEKHQAEEAAKTKQANKEEWQAKQELHQKALRQEHNALHKSAREHTAHVRAVSEERTQQVAKVEGQTIEQTLLVQQAMAQKLEEERLKAAAQAEAEARAEHFERDQREKREAAEAICKAEKHAAAKKMAIRKQREANEIAAREAAEEQKRLGMLREEKRQQTLEEVYRQTREQAQSRELEKEVHAEGRTRPPA